MEEVKPEAASEGGTAAPEVTDPPHLDKGWSWVVLAATFVAFFIMQGQLLTGNIYFIIYLQEFREPRSITAFTGAAYTAAVNLTGPLASILLRKFGPRFLLMTGGFIMSSGFLCIYPAQTIGQVIFASGIIRGIGASFIMTGCQASLSKYFCKRLYVATGIMYSASAIGMMTVGLMTEYVINDYGWRGSLVIQAGLTLHICLCGALVFKVPKKRQQLSLPQKNMERDQEGTKNRKWPWKTRREGVVVTKSRRWPWPNPSGEMATTKNRKSSKKDVDNGDATNKHLLQETTIDTKQSLENTKEDTKVNGSATTNNCPQEAMAQKTGSISGAITKNLPKHTAEGLSKNDGDATKNRKSSPKQYMGDVRFWCISGCTTMLFMFTSVVVIFWKDILPHKNHFKVAVVAMAAGSTLGRATAGFVSGRIAPPLHNCAVASCNALVILGFLVSDRVWVVAVHNFAWGFLNGQQTVADRLQLAWVFGRLEMPIVLGYSLIFVGVGGFMALPLAGFITDSTGSYLGTLLMTSAFSMTGAALSLILYFIHKKRLKDAICKESGGEDAQEMQVLNQIDVK